MASRGFRFQQFTIEQSRSAMRVSTDSVLLGAWGDVGCDACRLLDVGTGTGVIALMAAQRNVSATIDAVEIDARSAADAAVNFSASPWSKRMKLHVEAFADFCSERHVSYRYILSNPPFFGAGVRPPDVARQKARHADSLPADELFRGAAPLLEPEGRLSLIVPYARTEHYVAAAARCGLFAERRCSVSSVAQTPPTRMMLSFGAQPRPCQLEQLDIMEANRSEYTARYRELVKDFYLNL